MEPAKMRGHEGWHRLCGWARLPVQKRPSGGRVGRRHACIAIDAFVLLREGSFKLYEALAENGWLWCLRPAFRGAKNIRPGSSLLASLWDRVLAPSSCHLKRGQRRGASQASPRSLSGKEVEAGLLHKRDALAG